MNGIQSNLESSKGRRGLRARLPSPGFVILAASIAATATLIAYGLSEPELDRCWRALHELKTGRIEDLDGSQERLLRRTLARYPKLCPALLDEEPAGLISANTGGWIETGSAWMLADPKAREDPVAFVVCGLEEGAYPVVVTLEGDISKARIEFGAPGGRNVPLTAQLRERSGLIAVRLESCAGEKARGLDSGVQFLFRAGAK